MQNFRIEGAMTREDVGAAAQALIDLLDDLDGDADLEDATDVEDDFHLTDRAMGFAKGRGPGCDVSDTGEQAWIEWTTMRGSQKRGPNIAPIEDAEQDDEPEEDDPSGQHDEDGINTARYSYGCQHDGPGCALSDTGIGDSGGLQDAYQRANALRRIAFGR